MSSYSLEESDLLNLAKLAYELGCFGYLDLKDSKCESLVLDFIGENKNKLEKKSSNSIYGANDFSVSTLSVYSGSTFVVTSDMVDSVFN